MGKRGQKGFSLGGALLFCTIMAVLALGLCRLSVAHLWLSSHGNSGLQASSLANSAASAAMAKILESQEFGTTPNLETSHVILTTDQGGEAIVTFSPARALEEQVPHSTNNLAGTVPVEGSLDRTVQPGTVHVVATATSGSSRRTVEAVLRLPPFPWAIVAGGTLRTRENVLIGAMPPGVWPPPPDEELLPADMIANASGERAVVLGGGGTILGDVESPGGIVLEDPSMVIKGEVRTGAKPVDVPQLHAARYDPIAMGLDYDSLAGDLDPSAVLPLSGTVRRADLDMQVGGLELNGAHLFVEGNLTVNGPVTGNGVLICTGNVTIRDTQLQGSTELAILAEGDVVVRGGGRSSMVRGLLYAGGGLTAKDITVVGTVVAGQASAGVELENAGVIAEPVRPTTIERRTLYVGTPPPPDYDFLTPSAEMGRITDQRPPGGYLFSLQVEPSPQGGYPVTVTFALSPEMWEYRNFIWGAASDWRLESPEDYSAFIEELALELSPPAETERDPNLRATLRNLLDGQIAPVASTPGSLDLYGDLSRFLPFEDRARIVSWYER